MAAMGVEESSAGAGGPSGGESPNGGAEATDVCSQEAIDNPMGAPFPNPSPCAGVVVGLGSDLVEVDRVRRAIERSGDSFLKRVYTASELEYCAGKAVPWVHYAARFAAKEAISKAFGVGIGSELSWKSMGVVNTERGVPLVSLDDKAQELLKSLGAVSVSLTLSHTKGHAMAVALLLGRAPVGQA